jgi:LacI family transcriptional regulator
MTGRVGIRDVARLAGVSTTTVSHALSGRGKVSAATRQRVKRIALDLGYEPNRLATGLRSRRSGVMGFLSDEIATTPFAGRIVLGAQEAAADAGFTLMVVNLSRQVEVERRQIEVLRAQQVDAFLFASMYHREVQVPAGFQRGPVVVINAEETTRSHPSIAPDEYRVGVDATRLLLEAGHRRISHLTLLTAPIGVVQREAGYRDTMLDAGLQPHVVKVDPPAESAAGRAAFARAIVDVPDVTAVFVFNDPMSMGVYQAAAASGKRVPDDLSIVSVDNLELISAQLLPGLTTFELPHYEMGRWAVAQALLRLDDAEAPPEIVLQVCRLIRRDSVRAPS